MGSKSTYRVERQRRIDAPPSVVLERIVDFRLWPQWSPWEDLDPNQTRTFGGADSGVGATYAWEGNRKAGAGNMEITAVEPDGSVEMSLRFERPFKSEAKTSFAVTPDGDGSQVVWSMVGPLSRMMRVMSIVWSMDKMIGKDFDKGLDRLASQVERGGET